MDSLPGGPQAGRVRQTGTQTDRHVRRQRAELMRPRIALVLSSRNRAQAQNKSKKESGAALSMLSYLIQTIPSISPRSSPKCEGVHPLAFDSTDARFLASKEGLGKLESSKGGMQPHAR